MKLMPCIVLGFLATCFSFSANAQVPAPKPSPAAPSSPRGITVDDFFQIRDVAQPELSPDGQWVAYSVRTRMLKEDKNEQRLSMVSTHGGDPIPMTAEGVSSSHPRWSTDGKYLAFLSTPNGGKNQICPPDRPGTPAHRRPQ